MHRDLNETGNHIHRIVAEDLDSGRYDRVLTRFAPEPNAYIHIGSAISAHMTFGAAEQFGGRYNLRFDDTNPATEEQEFVDAIRDDLHWLGYEWEDREFFASDYFNQLYEFAVQLIKDGKAYVCDLSEEEVRSQRGTNSFDAQGRRLTAPGRESPYRNRSLEENLSLFADMKAGAFEEGSRTLRAKIDMAHDNFLMRDPIMYRIVDAEHHRAGRSWCIFPTYDWAHGQSDSIEGITHSICGMEFRVHHELYDWFLDQLGIFHPRQVEYSRVDLTYTVTGKRYLKRLVETGVVSGWNDPRLPTIRGLRRRGLPPDVLREFCSQLSVSDRTIRSSADYHLFEFVARQHLNQVAPRRMAVLRPLKLVITTFPEDHEEELEAINNPEDPSAGSRPIPFSRELYIERNDFMESPEPRFRRLAPGREVRLRYAYLVTCVAVVHDASGEIGEVHCTHDANSRGGDAPDGRKVKSTLHWVSARHCVPLEARLYGPLFNVPDPLARADSEDWLEHVNRDAVEILSGFGEPLVSDLPVGSTCQFERLGYFCADRESEAGAPVFNSTMPLRDKGGWNRQNITTR